MIFLLLSCIAIDGDTLKCDGQRYRLVGIDAPEMPGHCRKGRQCAPGDPYDSKANLARLIDGKPVQIEIITKDRYGRSIALASVEGADLSCAQINAGQAVYIAKWDNGKRVASLCKN